jgi:hypothetical protein
MWFILLIFPQKSEDLSEISLLFVFCVEGREKEVPEGKINKKEYLHFQIIFQRVLQL